MNLSKQAVRDLRKAISNSYGKDLDESLSDEEINEIGDLLLNIIG